MIANKSGLEKHLIPSGWHPAYCFGLIGIGDISTKYGPLTCVRLLFELPGVIWQDEQGNRGVKTISEKFPLKMGNHTAPSQLAMFLEGWRGKQFTPAEYASFDLRKILGAAACLKVLEQTSSRGTTYNTIEKIEAAKKHPDGKGLYCPGLVPSDSVDFPQPTMTKIYYDPADPQPDIFAQLPKWIQREMIANNAAPNSPEPEPAPQTHHQPTKAAPATDYSDDDIPF